MPPVIMLDASGSSSESDDSAIRPAATPPPAPGPSLVIDYSKHKSVITISDDDKTPKKSSAAPQTPVYRPKPFVARKVRKRPTSPVPEKEDGPRKPVQTKGKGRKAVAVDESEEEAPRKAKPAQKTATRKVVASDGDGRPEPAKRKAKLQDKARRPSSPSASEEEIISVKPVKGKGRKSLTNIKLAEFEPLEQSEEESDGQEAERQRRATAKAALEESNGNLKDVNTMALPTPKTSKGKRKELGALPAQKKKTPRTTSSAPAKGKWEDALQTLMAAKASKAKKTTSQTNLESFYSTSSKAKKTTTSKRVMEDLDSSSSSSGGAPQKPPAPVQPGKKKPVSVRAPSKKSMVPALKVHAGSLSEQKPEPSKAKGLKPAVKGSQAAAVFKSKKSAFKRPGLELESDHQLFREDRAPSPIDIADTDDKSHSESPPPPRKNKGQAKPTGDSWTPILAQPESESNDSEAIIDSAHRKKAKNSSKPPAFSSYVQVVSSTNKRKRKADSGAAQTPRTEKRKKKRFGSASRSEEDAEPDDLELSDKELFDTRLRSQRDSATPKGDRFAVLKAARIRKQKAEQRKSLIEKGIMPESDDDDDVDPELVSPRYMTHLEDLESMASDEEIEAAKEEEAFIEPDGTNMDRLRAMIPTQLTANVFQNMGWQVQNLILLFIHQQVYPQEEWETVDQSFKTSREKVTQKCTDTINSLLRSQAWTPRFNRATDLPQLVETPCPEHQGCDACNLHGRISRVQVSFWGRRYHPATFKAVKDSDESGSASDSDSSSDSEDHSKGPFYIGRECLRRVNMLHTVKHLVWSVWRETSHEVNRLRSSDEDEEPPGWRKDFEEWKRNRLEEIAMIRMTLDHSKFFVRQAQRVTDALDEARLAYAK